MKNIILILLFILNYIDSYAQVELINVRFEIKNEWEKNALRNASLKIFDSADNIELSRTKEDSLPIVVKLIKGKIYKLKASAKCHLVKRINLQIPNEIADDEYGVLIELQRYTHCPSMTLYQRFEINYKKNENILSESDESILDSLGYVIIQNPEIALHIYGHTDHQEDSIMGDKRISVVKDYLLEIGVQKAQIKTQNMGANQPLINLNEINNLGSDEERKEAFHLNRRISFGIYHLDEKLK